jgi:transcription initiation factor TFIID subunit 1
MCDASERNTSGCCKGIVGSRPKTKKFSLTCLILVYSISAPCLTVSFYKSVAQFIYEELQLAPWHLTGEFIEVHKKGEGTGMMKLTGLGDPSGVGEGFSFLREADTKPTKSFGIGPINAQNAQMKKITGTEDDLRKLTMKQMAKILRSYGMAQKQIETLKRWDRVHVIRDLSTKAASDGIGDGLERFARGEKMKLSEQKQMYRDRIQVISKRQIAALSAESADGRVAGVDGAGVSTEADDAVAARPAQQNKDEAAKDNSDSESDDDDFAALMEDEMKGNPEANQLVADQARDTGAMAGDASRGQLRKQAQDQDLTKDARELAALKRQREEERAAREGVSLLAPSAKASMATSQVDRKIIRKRITRTYPDGRQTTTFKFVIHPDEVATTMVRLQLQKNSDRGQKKDMPEYQPDDRQIGHAMFEDDDDFEYSTRGRNSMHKRRGGNRRGRAGPGGAAKAPPRKKEFQFGKLKNKVSKEQRLKKRKRDEEEPEIYTSVAKRKGTSNRKERGSIRERRPHVILADRFESIRGMIESRPHSGPFVKPVNRRQIPKYYEVISDPIDLSTIRDKIQK